MFLIVYEKMKSTQKLYNNFCIIQQFQSKLNI